MAVNGERVGINGPLDMSSDPTPPHGNILVCQVCESDFRNPRLLPCLHSFCESCLESSLEGGQIGPGQAFLCPLCRTRCVVPAGRGVRDMPANCLASAVLEFGRSKAAPEGDEAECGGCRSADIVQKCIECGDWLCRECCTLHSKVKLTKDHHLATFQEIQSGKYDDLIKEGLESSLLCGKHGEPLRYFCEEDTCRVPICHLCKMTAGHDGHSTVALADQASSEARRIQQLLPNLARCIRSAEAKLDNLAQDEKMTAYIRKRLHRKLIERTEVVVERFMRAVHEYVDTLHQSVETAIECHRNEVAMETEAVKNRLEAAKTAKTYAEALVGFSRAEELLTLSDEVCSRLAEFQTPTDSAPPAWKKPRLDMADVEDDVSAETIEDHFGSLVFEGDVAKSVMSKTFSARLETDEKACKLCDLGIDLDGNVVVADRDNQVVKIFDEDGNLRLGANLKRTLKAPNRVAVLKKSRRILVKDGRLLKLMSLSGEPAGTFGDHLKQPVAIAESDEGEIYVTEWLGGEVIVFDSGGKKLRSFPCACEAPGYISTSQNGNIILTDWKRHVVKIFDRRGKLRGEYGSHGNGDGQLDHPYGVCTDDRNNIFVCDTWNNRILVLSPEGQFVKTLLTKSDGIEWPQAIAIDKRTGHLVIAEQYGLIKYYEYLV